RPRRSRGSMTRSGNRSTAPGHNRVLMTAGAAALFGDLLSAAGQQRQRQLLDTVRGHAAFTADTDPYGKHDFGRFALFGEALYWKIDYYDRRLESVSPDLTDRD